MEIAKRGQITMKYLIVLVLAIIGFVIVLILLFSLEFESFSEDEICKLSVLSRASVPSAGQGYVPLKCSTKKYCITDNNFIGGGCDQFAGENNVKMVRLKGSVEAKADQIEAVSAEAMRTCWTQMGEGKLDLFAEKVDVNPLNAVENFFNLGDKGPSCVICSRVALSKDVLDDEELLKKVDVNEYMEKTQVPGSSLTYLQTFTDSQVRAYSGEIETELGSGENLKRGTDQLAMLFMQIKTDEDPTDAFTEGALGTAGFIFGSSYAFGVVGKLVKNPYTIALSVVASLGGGLVKAAGAAEAQQISVATCGQFSKSGNDQKNKHGCSAVVPVDYNNIARVNKLCGKIEGNP
jgi:hypothetical protein